jgi:hypothetical protein
MATYAALIALSAYQAPDAFRFRTERYEFVDDIPAVDLLAGSADLREGIRDGREPMALVETVCAVNDTDEAAHRRAVERVVEAEARRG